MGFIPGMKVWFNIHVSIIAMHFKEKSQDHINNAEKVFVKIEDIFMKTT